MKKFISILFLFSCAKQVDRCPELLYVATTYENGKVVEELVTNFGQVCGDELEYYLGVIAGQPGKGVMICPPVPQYGKWILKQ